MSGMVERVARAICSRTNIAMEGVTDVIFDDPDREYMAWVQGSGYVKPTKRWELYVDRARAAIEAMRDLTETMRAAALADIDDDPGYGLYEITSCHHAMIDAELASA